MSSIEKLRQLNLPPPEAMGKVTPPFSLSHPEDASDRTIKAIHLVDRLKEVLAQNDLEALRKYATGDVIANIGYLLIDLAISSPNKECAATLVALGAPVSEAAALKAVEEANLPVVQAYLDQNESLSPLLLPKVLKKSPIDRPMFDLLVQRKVPDSQPSAIFLAVQHDESYFLQELLAHGYQADAESYRPAATPANIDLLIRHGTPFNESTIAALAGHGCDAEIEKMWKKGAPISPLALVFALHHRRLSTICLLLKLKAPIDPDIFQAAIVGRNEMATFVLLLESGARFNGETLAHAIKFRELGLWDFLLSKGAKITSSTVKAAIEINDEQLVRKLIREGAPIVDDYLYGISGTCSRSLFDYILSLTQEIPEQAFRGCFVHQSHEDALYFSQALVRRGAKLSPYCLNYCVLWGHLEALKYLVSAGAPTEKLKLSDSYRSNSSREMFHYLLTLPKIHLDLSGLKEMPIEYKKDFISYLQRNLAKLTPFYGPLISEDNIESLVRVLEKNLDFIERTFDLKWDLLDWIEKSISSLLYYSVPLESSGLHWLSFSSLKWKLLFPHFG